MHRQFSGERTAFLTNGSGTIEYPCTKKRKKQTLNYTLHYIHKTNSKWSKLNVKPKIFKLRKENMGKNLCYLGLGKDFLSRTQKA